MVHLFGLFYKNIFNRKTYRSRYLIYKLLFWFILLEQESAESGQGSSEIQTEDASLGAADVLVSEIGSQKSGNPTTNMFIRLN